MVLWIKDFMVLNLIVFSWLLSMRGGKNKEGGGVPGDPFTYVQIIKSCRCGPHCGAKLVFLQTFFKT